MTREEFVTASEIAFERLMRPADGLSPELLEEPMSPGEMSFKETCLFMSFWNEQAVCALESLYVGTTFDWSIFSKREEKQLEVVAARAGSPLRRVLGELRITHSTVMEAARRLPACNLDAEGAMPEWLVENVPQLYEFYREQVEDWATRLRKEGRIGGDLPVLR